MIRVKENKKTILRWIREQVKLLDPEYYTAYSKYLKPQLVEEDGKKFLKIAEPELFPVNHKRRAYKAYVDGGLQGITDYFQRRGFELKANEKPSSV